MSQQQGDVSKPPQLADSDLDKAEAIRKENQIRPKAAFKVGDKVKTIIREFLPEGGSRLIDADFYVAHRDTPVGQSYWMYRLTKFPLTKEKELTGPLFESEGKTWFPETDLDDAA